MTNEAPLSEAGAAPVAIRQGSKRCVWASRTRVVKKSSDQSAVELYHSFPSSALLPLKETAAEVTAEWSGLGHTTPPPPPSDIPQPHQGLGPRLVAGAWSEVEAQPRLWRLPARTRVFVSHTNSSQTFGRQRDSERLRDSRQGSSSLQSASAWPLFKAPVQEPWCLDVGQTNVSACSAESSGSFVPMLLQFTGTSGSGSRVSDWAKLPRDHHRSSPS